MRLLKFLLVGCLVAVLVAGAAFAAEPKPPPPIVVGGVITAIDLDAKSVTLNGPIAGTDPAEPAPRQVTFFVNEKTKIIKNGKPAGLADLAVKDECKAACVRTSAGLVAIEVVAKTPVPPLAHVCGTIAGIDLEHSTFKLKLNQEQGREARVMEFYIDRGTVIRKDGKPASFGDLKVEDLACVAFAPLIPTVIPTEPIRAAVVEARTPPVPIVHVIGKLVFIGQTRLIGVLPREATAPLHFQVTDETKIVKMKPAPFDALMVGDSVDVAFHKPAESVIPKALAITVLPEGYRGIIVSVDLVLGIVVCQQSPTSTAGAVTIGPTIAFKVVEETIILKNGVRVPLKALQPRDLAEVKFFRFREHNVAAAIHARSPITPPGPRL